MTRKHLAVLARVVVVASLVSALVAYRLGSRREAYAPRADPTTASTSGCVDFRDAAAHAYTAISGK